MTGNETLLKMKHGGRYYGFCHFTVALCDAVLQSGNEVLLQSSAHFLKKLSSAEFSGLRRKFMPSSVDSQASVADIALSSHSISSLLLMSASIAGILLSDEADALKGVAAVTFSDIPDSWDKMYLKNAQTFFNQFKERFKNNPTFEPYLKVLLAQ